MSRKQRAISAKTAQQILRLGYASEMTSRTCHGDKLVALHLRSRVKEEAHRRFGCFWLDATFIQTRNGKKADFISAGSGIANSARSPFSSRHKANQTTKWSVSLF